MNEGAWENLNTSGRIDHELIREYLDDAPVRFGERELKLEWIILRWWAPEKQTEKNLELLRMGEKNSHDQNNYERMASS